MLFCRGVLDFERVIEANKAIGRCLHSTLDYAVAVDVVRLSWRRFRV